MITTFKNIDINIFRIINYKIMNKNVALIGGEFVGKTSLFSYIINSSVGNYTKDKSSSQLSKKMDDFFGDRINDECLFLSSIYKNTTINFFDTKWQKNITQNLYKKLAHCESVIFVLDIRNHEIADIYEQLTLLYILGIKHIVFAFNKIDLYSFSESKSRFMKLRKSILNLMREIGLKKHDKYFVPISSYSGDNIRKTSGLKWYDTYLKNMNISTSSGSLLDFVIKKPQNKEIENLLNVKSLITKVYYPINHSPVFTGISTDKIELTKPYYLQPGNNLICLKLLQSDHNDKESVSKNQNIAFTIIEPNIEINKVSHSALTSNKSIGFNRFVCKIIVKNIPKIKTNTEFILNFNTKCKLKKVFSILDKDEKNILSEHTSVISQNQTAIVLIETTENIFLECFDKNKNSGKTGRIILQNNLKEIIGFGIVKGIKE
jgi:sulfate adenylyltransferase subunit 1